MYCFSKSEKDFYNKRVLQVSDCTKDEYFEPVYQQCKPCDPSCKGCFNHYQCKSCPTFLIFFGSDYLNDKSCGTCPPGTTQQQNECRGCANTCTSCSNNGLTCLNCKDKSKYIYEEKAVCDTCDADGWYKDGIYCSRCHYSCSKCTGKNENQCLTCKSDIMQYPDGRCIYNPNNKCDDGYYKDGMSCVKCNTNCGKCTSFTYCTLCTQDANNQRKIYPDGSCDQCIKGYYIYNDKCLKCQNQCLDCTSQTKCTLCSDGYFVQSGQCVACTSGFNCKSCIDSTSCKTCQPNQYIQSNFKCSACTAGYYIDDIYCKQCAQNCALCSNLQTCSKCVATYSFDENKKCIKCPVNGYYINKPSNENECRKCKLDYNCLKCVDGEKCTECDSTSLNKYYYPSVGNCGKCQEEGYFVNNANQCVKCVDSLNCKTCSNSSSCISCQSLFYLTEDNQCVKCDQEKQYIDGIQCKKCHPNCRICTKESCSSCIDGKYLYDQGKCDDCIDNYYISSGKYCKSCQGNCLTCTSETQCKTCKSPFLLYSDDTCKECIDGYYIQDSNIQKQCLQCNSGIFCKTCSNSTTCNTCQDNYFKNKNKQCVKCLEDGVYQKNDECFECKPTLNCQTCNENSCISCPLNKYLFKEGNCSDCKTNDGYFIDSNKCTQCNTSALCKSCDNITNCLSCYPSQYLNIETKICENCSAVGYYKDGTYCKKCDPTLKCNQCQLQGSNIDCIDCQPNYYLDKNKKCQECDSDGYFKEQSSKQCLECNSSLSCKTCLNANECVSCYPGKFFNEQNSCVDCLDGYYIINDRCKKCSAQLNCLTCKNEISCETCVINYYLDQSQKCVLCDQEGEYKHEKLCKQCNPLLNCKTCLVGDQCDSCNGLDKIQNAFNCAPCGDGFYVEGKFCKQCNSSLNCKTCLNSTSCEECKDGDLLKGNKSCGTCEEGYYPNGKVCSKCYDNCKACKGLGQYDCISCNKLGEYLFNEGNCGSCPQDNEYTIKGQNCVKCPQNCLKCTGNNENECTQCNPMFSFVNTNNKCDICSKDNSKYIASCQQCKDGTEYCEICKQDKFFGQDKKCNTCVLSDGYFIDGTNCAKCDQSCKTCNGPSVNDCLECQGERKFIEINGKQQCQICDVENQYYINDKQCLPCDSSCKKCRGSTKQDCDVCLTLLAFNKSMVCEPCIAEGWYNDQAITKCIECAPNCKICSGNTTLDCSECKDNFYFYNENTEKNQCFECPANSFYKYSQDGKRFCGKCHFSCETCRGPSDKDCLTCITPKKFMPDGTCDTCPEFDYYQEGDQCKRCDNSCSKCKGSTNLDCTQCKQDLYYHIDKQNSTKACKTCDTNMNFYIESLNCEICHPSCKTCNGGTDKNCTKCEQPLALYDNNQCKLCNQEDQYFLTEENKCKSCDPSCKTCKGGSVNDCKLCNEPFKYFADTQTCQTCPSEFYFISGNDCKKCHPFCKTCLDETNLKCDICSIGNYKKSTDGSCIDKCPTDNQFYILNSDCLPCDETCKTCNGGGQNQCKLCKDGLFYEQEKQLCLDCSLLKDHFVDGLICRPCHQSCTSCVGPNPEDCISCQNNLYFKSQVKDSNLILHGKCESCDDYFYTEGVFCLPCDKSCKTCSGKLITDCIKCNQNLFKENGLCIDCIQANSKYVEGEECKTCYNSCQTCNDGKENSCTSCKDNFYFKEGEDMGKCLTCPTSNNFYISYKFCKKCHPTCKTCSDNINTACTTCEVGFYRKENEENVCQSCPQDNQYFIDGIKCLKCHESCQTCSKNTESNCLSCAQNYFFNADKSKCIKCNTDNGYFITPDKLQCLQCHPSCKTCKGNADTECLLCNTNKYKNQDDNYVKCQECPVEKYFIENGDQKCSKCDSTCQTCKNKETTGCTKCDASLYFSTDQTCKICPSTNFFIQGDQCKPCHSSCLTCSGITDQDCITCQTNLYFKEGDQVKQCVDCPSQYYFKIESSQQCSKCYSTCETCRGNGKTECIKCKGEGHFKSNGECGSCETNEYVDKTDNKCKLCHYSCKTCSGNGQENECTYCVDNKYFNSQHICTSCDTANGYFISSQNCLKCHETCQTCSSESLLDCNTCVVNRYKKEDDGYQKCDICNISDRYFIEPGNQRCSKCHESCQSCRGKGDKECSTCRDGLKRWTDLTCKSCALPKYFVEGDYCKECHASCSECNQSGDTNCTVCEKGLSFYQGKCVACNINNGQYIDKTKNTCLDCHQSCQTCNGVGENNCIICKTNLYKNGNNLCQFCDIANGYFIQGENCKKCHSTCLTCLGSDQMNSCTSCHSSNKEFLYKDNSCKACILENGYYIEKNQNPNLNKCLPCHSDCKTCDGGKQESCILCNLDHYFFDNNHYCKKCHKDCDTCIGSEQNQCEKCLEQGKYLSVEKNICSNCKQNEFNDGKKCLSCSQNCIKCKDSKTCLECGNNTQIKLDLSCGQCEKNQFINNLNECKECHQDCMSCVGPSKTQCNQCIDSKKRINKLNECGICDKNQYSDNIRCYNCHKDCSTCIGQSNLDCTTCIDQNTYFCNPQDINNFSSQFGVHKCEKSCIICDKNCATCFGPGINQCMTCLVGILQEDFSCSKWCPKGMYFHEQKIKCEKCDANCLECTNTNECQTCESDYINYLGNCYKCLSHQFLDKKDTLCKECHSSCKTCFGEQSYQCNDCIDENAFVDQFNTCVYTCSDGYIKNMKNKKCQQCFYQQNPDKQKICVLECEPNQFGDLSTRMCINCKDKCDRCTSLNYCTQCQQGLSFLNFKQEDCGYCQSNQFSNSKNQCENCPQLNCQSCNQNQCTKCIHEYKLEKETKLCVYDTRYNSYKCTGVNTEDDSCEKEIEFINNSDLVLKSSQYSYVVIQTLGAFTIGTGSSIGYTIQIQQIIGNNKFYQEKLKTLSLGPTFYETNYQMNILSMIPNPFQYLPSYKKYIGNGQETDNTNNQKTIDQTKQTHIQNQSENLKDKRILKNEVTNNGLSSFQSIDLSKQFLDQFFVYLTVMIIICAIIVICSCFDPQRNIFFDMVHEKKFSIIIQVQMIFSNFVFLSIFKSLKELDFSSLRVIDYISLTTQIIYIILYFFFAIRILLKIKKYDRKNEDLSEVKVYMGLIKNIYTDKSYNKYFWYFFEVRKILNLIAIFFIPNLIISCIILIILNSFFVVYHLLQNPFFILLEQRYFYTLEILNLINSIALMTFLITDYKISAWITLFTIALINFIILFFTLYSLGKSLYIKIFQKRFIISTSNQYDIDYKWKQINENNLNVKAIKFLKAKSTSLRSSSPSKQPRDSQIINDSFSISNVSSPHDYPVDLNELSIKWSMNPIFTRHIALQQFSQDQK